MIRFLIALSAVLAFANTVIAGPRVDIIIGEKAPALERLAADELSNQLKRVYEAEVKIASTAPADALHVIFVGSPDTNASMKPFADSWPGGDKKLTDQGHLLRSVTHKNKPALLIGGGSPVATYWAVAEFGHHLGIRSMFFGDLDPISPPPFKLNGLDAVLEPMMRTRSWRFNLTSMSDAAAWSLSDFRSVLRQLAKLKFNRISVEFIAGAPFVHFEYAGVKRQTVMEPSYSPISVAGDTSGRRAFGGAKLFVNPAFAETRTYDERISAGQSLLRALIESAKELGIVVSITTSPAAFPNEFASTLGERDGAGGRASLVFTPKITSDSKDERLKGLVKAQWEAYLETYPALQEFDVSFPAKVSSGNSLGQWLIESLRERSRTIALRTWSIEEFGNQHQMVLAPVSANGVEAGHSKRLLLFSLDSTNPALPMMNLTTATTTLDVFSKSHCDGFEIRTSGIGDADLLAYWFSRRGFGENTSLEQCCREFVDPVCGDGVSDRAWKAFLLSDQTAQTLRTNSIRVTDFLSPRFFHFIGTSDEPPPSWWGSIRDDYLNAMNEMYRANTRAREGGRAFTLYFARRFEFAFEYMNCMEAVRKAGIAERKIDTSTQIAELEKAIESLNNALNAMAAVARSNSDRGLIAELNEYGDRPLKRKLAEAEEAAK